MNKSFVVWFSEQVAATCVQVDAASTPATVGSAITDFDLELGRRPVLVVIGGASKLSADDERQVRALFDQVLAPIAQKWNACVVDGGTDAGVMRLMGQGRAAIQGTFPLIGVAPSGLAVLPDQPIVSENQAVLEPNHTHFILIPGNTWGDESPWLAQVASVVAAAAPSVTVLVNGGEVAWEDAKQNLGAGRSLIVIAGSGRTADCVAAGLRGEPTDQRAQGILASGRVHAVPLAEEMGEVARMIDQIFAGKGTKVRSGILRKDNHRVE